MGEPSPQPPAILTKEQAVERVKAYAAANGLAYRDALDIHLHRQPRDQSDRKAGYRYVYTMALGTSRPVPFVDVDAADGAVLAWRSPAR